MNLTLLLPWFPIILGVGVGGRLLGRARGFGLGILCALFWVVLVQASVESGVWQQQWTVASLVAGALAIVAMGGWSGETADEKERLAGATRDGRTPQSPPLAGENESTLDRISSALDQFDDWLADHRNDADPWPKFDEFVRNVLYQCCRATHVRPYRLSSEGEELVPLREPDPLTDLKRLSTRLGIVGHVVTTGRSYIFNDITQGELVSRLAEESKEPTAWCFAISHGTRRLGTVTVGHLDIAPERNKRLLRVVERLVAQFWCTLTEACRCRSAVLADPVSGLHTREAFLRAAEHSLSESYAQGEPVAVAIIALEHLRELNDSGRWEVADEVVCEASTTLRQKIRADDCLGRFDGSRFILLLRRVDSELASLIVAQTMSRLTTLCGDDSRWRTPIAVRCGLVGSGTERPDIRTLVSRALVQCHRARREDIRIASDLRPAPAVGSVPQ